MASKLLAFFGGHLADPLGTVETGIPSPGAGDFWRRDSVSYVFCLQSSKAPSALAPASQEPSPAASAEADGKVCCASSSACMLKGPLTSSLWGASEGLVRPCVTGPPAAQHLYYLGDGLALVFSRRLTELRSNPKRKFACAFHAWFLSFAC